MKNHEFRNEKQKSFIQKCFIFSIQLIYIGKFMTNTIDFLRFKDWITLPDNDINWIVIAQSRRSKEDSSRSDFFTTSILVDSCYHKVIIEKNEWLVDLKFGNAEIWHMNKKLIYDPNTTNSIEINHTKWNISPFIIYRVWQHKLWVSKFEIIQDFILFYNLYWDKKDKTYKAISNMGNVFEVIKIREESDDNGEHDTVIEINKHFLRNYLAIKNKFLIRQHDHKRYTFESLQSLIKKDEERIKYSNDFYNYEVVLRECPCTLYTSFSLLRGMDVVLPYKKKHALLEWEEDNFSSFKVGVNDDGKPIKKTCNRNKLGNEFLTSVFFKREVLQKYYNSEIYTVNSYSVNCSGLWVLPIDTTERDLIHVWLGDLGDIPPDEQKYWEGFNIIPEGTITKSRFERDILAQFSDSTDKMAVFWSTFNEFQKWFENNYGIKLFMELKNEDKYIYNNLRIPLNESRPEFDAQIGNLAKLLPDSIDIKSLEKLILKDAEKEEIEEFIGKKIRLLKFFFDKKQIDSKFVAVLDLIQNVRSACVVHRRGKNCHKLLKKHNLIEITNKKIFERFILDLVISFQKIMKSKSKNDDTS